MYPLLSTFCCALLFGAMSQVALAEDANSSVRVLDAAAKEVHKTVVRHSMMGPRDTLVFYAFKEQKVVLVLRIGNKNTDFPITATAHVFAEGATAEGLGMWINNQHSDGLFPDVPEPISRHELPADVCKVVAQKKGERVDHRTHIDQAKQFDDYTVDFKVTAFEKKGVIQLKAFADQAQVLVEVQPPA